jgi:hypothetical protein
MSITIEGNAASADIETLMQRVSEHPEEYGLTRVAGVTDFTWEEVARVVDHDGVADGRVDDRDGDVFVRDGRLSLTRFRSMVGDIHRGLRGRSGVISVDPCSSERRALRSADTELNAAMEGLSFGELAAGNFSNIAGVFRLFDIRSSASAALTSCDVVYSIP